eukprot:GILI01023988.1.p1 GENE.GILI01023988.1~~GILI01023988.1.p1  ORF type:complete len:206 (+),score=27.35 GILI01023988.1:38-619(+)
MDIDIRHPVDVAISAFKYKVHIVVVGPTSAGKSHICDFLCSKPFQNRMSYPFNAVNTAAAVGQDFANIQLVDTTGFKAVSAVQPFVSMSHGVILVYDRTKPDGLSELAARWEEVRGSQPPNVPIIVVGNKSDLVEQLVPVEQDPNLAYLRDLPNFEVSAVTGVGISDAFLFLLQHIIVTIPDRVLIKAPPAEA